MYAKEAQFIPSRHVDISKDNIWRMLPRHFEGKATPE